MTPQYEHQLPNGRRLNVVDIEPAQKHLATLINGYDAGDDRPLIIGDENAPKAVVLPINQWLELLEIADQAAADEHIANDARSALADPRPPVPYEHLLKAVQAARSAGVWIETMDDPYDLVIHSRLLERLALKAYESARDPVGISSRELHAARWLDVLRQGREEFFDGKRLGRSDKHAQWTK